MITSRVKVTDRFPEITRAVELRAKAALEAAAIEAARVAEQQANHPKPIAHVTPLRAQPIGDGFVSGVKLGPLTRIFDKGSLSHHTGTLKNARKTSWEVSRRGANPYVAHRRSLGGGVAPRRILTAARKAGRAVLIARLTGR